MTLFVQTKNRLFEIDDAYVMALVYILTYVIVRIVKKAVLKYRENQKRKVDIPNPTGGINLELDTSDYDSDLANSILTCIADNERYLVQNPTIRKLIFNLVGAKIKNESLVLTPNMIRFLALKLLKNDKHLVVKVGSLLVSTQSRNRICTRISSSFLIGIMAGIGATVSYGIVLMLLVYSLSGNCGYPCQTYERLPSAGPVRVFEKQSTGHLIIAGKDVARPVEIYLPSPDRNQIETIQKSNNGFEKTTHDSPSRTKARAVNFSDFKKTDPVLSAFDNLEEPIVPQKVCDLSIDNMLD